MTDTACTQVIDSLKTLPMCIVHGPVGSDKLRFLQQAAARLSQHSRDSFVVIETIDNSVDFDDLAFYSRLSQRNIRRHICGFESKIDKTYVFLLIHPRHVERCGATHTHFQNMMTDIVMNTHPKTTRIKAVVFTNDYLMNAPVNDKTTKVPHKHFFASLQAQAKANVVRTLSFKRFTFTEITMFGCLCDLSTPCDMMFSLDELPNISAARLRSNTFPEVQNTFEMSWNGRRIRKVHDLLDREKKLHQQRVASSLRAALPALTSSVCFDVKDMVARHCQMNVEQAFSPKQIFHAVLELSKNEACRMWNVGYRCQRNEQANRIILEVRVCVDKKTHRLAAQEISDQISKFSLVE